MLDTELADIRHRTRAAQHIASFPLLIVGVLCVNYGVFNFLAYERERRVA